MKQDKRFLVTYTQGTLETIKILVDQETGVNYIQTNSGYGAGITPLLGRDGKPVISPVIK